jgi:hypothetical protein
VKTSGGSSIGVILAFSIIIAGGAMIYYKNHQAAIPDLPSQSSTVATFTIVPVPFTTIFTLPCPTGHGCSKSSICSDGRTVWAARDEGDGNVMCYVKDRP